MAQTIAMQRGTTTTASGFTSTTIFTQSSGNATRVIFNGFAIKLLSSNNQYWSSLCLVTSGGATHVLGWGQWYAGGNQFVPMATMANVAFQPGAASNATLQLPTAWAAQSTANYPGSITPQSVANGYQGLALGGGMPQNFWMGPGDSIVFRNDPYATTIGWSFTTITES